MAEFKIEDNNTVAQIFPFIKQIQCWKCIILCREGSRNPQLTRQPPSYLKKKKKIYTVLYDAK